MALNDQHWFTEVCDKEGTAFALKIRRKLHEEQTPYQKIEIFETETFGNLMIIDGCTMVTSRDNFLYHEMMTHPVLFTHPNPKRVLIIGGGDCGTLREVLKHPGIETAQQVDIDERVTRLSEHYFPELCESNHDPRAELHFADGIKWVKEAADESYDVIIVDSNDPVGPGEVLFTAEFYQHCRRVLGNSGIIVQQSESPLLHPHILSKMYELLQQAGFSQLATLNFPQPIYPSGWWSATMATNGATNSATNGTIPGCNAPFDLHKPNLDAAQAADLQTEYYNPAIHLGALTIPGFVSRYLDK